MTTTDVRPATALSTLYLSRFAFAIVWAVLLAVSVVALGTAGSISALTAVLLIAYPAFDLVAAVVDRRRASTAASSALLIVNIVLSALTAIGLIVAVMSGASAVVLVWGLWAITAGAVQLIVGLRRRALGGQWAMILSGGISVLAGAGFVAQSAGTSPSLVGLAGYAVLGGVFFLISALRLRRGSDVDGR